MPYVIDLLQYTYGDYYLHVISDMARSHTFPMVEDMGIKHDYGDQKKWYMYQDTGFKTWTLLILMCACWVIQKYFQDGLISWLYGKYLLRSRSVGVIATPQAHSA